jgi:succinate-semialdehyde dehydrogenase/glutarate-semialdehyde dehydrogenase
MNILTRSIIDGEDIDGPGSIQSINPATEETVGTASALDREGAARAVEAAKRAFPSWAATPVEERQRILGRWLEIMVEEAGQVAALMSAEMGKPLSEATLVDVVPSCATLDYMRRTAHELLAFRPVKPELLLATHWQAGYRFDPLGVMTIITPWNYPVAIPMWGLVPALAAGNTVVMKPASDTVLTGLMLADQARRAGMPPGVFNSVALPGSATDVLLDHPDVAKVLFTGSVPVGRHVAGKCAQRLLPVQLELGGKDAAVVAADAPLDRTASGLVWGGFMNTGQSCASVERVYVVEELYEPLVRKMVALTKKLKVGDPTAPDTDLGPLANSGQRAEVSAQVEEALAKGATALTGGALPDGPGFFYPPTILVDVTDEMVVMAEETFGPVVPVIKVADVDEGIRRANDSNFGLAASGWTRSDALADRFRRELDAGAVGINEHGIVAAGEVTASWGGLRESGIGRAHGPYGLHEMVNIKYVFTDDGAGAASAWHYPYDDDFSTFIKASVPMLFGSGISRYQTLDDMASTRRFRERVRKLELLKNVKKFI